MATIDLGKIKLLWRGTYNNSTAYAVDDVLFTGVEIPNAVLGKGGCSKLLNKSFEK